MKSLVSIIIPCYNQAQYLSEALDSVLEQIYPNWECIIVNDGSPDNAEEIAESYLIKDQRFKYIKINNSGVSVARNKGILESSGIYILPLDADDKIDEDYLFEAIKLLDENRSLKLVYSKAEFFGDESGLWHLPDYKFENILVDNMIFCSAVYRRADYDKTKGYNPNMIYGLEDWDFWVSLLKYSDEVYCLPSVQFYYRKRRSTRSKAMDEEKAKRMKKQLYLNNEDKYDEAFGDPISAYKKIYELEARITFLNNEIEKINRDKEYINSLFLNFKNSLSFKAGRVITSPLRLFRDLGRKS